MGQHYLAFDVRWHPRCIQIGLTASNCHLSLHLAVISFDADLELRIK